MIKLIFFEEWDPRIPVEFNEERLEAFDPKLRGILSLDGTQYVEIEGNDAQIIISIMQEKQVVNQITILGPRPSYNCPKQICFSSEYLLLLEKENLNLYVYFHNFIHNKGRSLVFQNQQFASYFIQRTVLYLLLKSMEETLQLYRIDQKNFQLINELYFHDQYILQNNDIGFFIQKENIFSLLYKSSLKKLNQFKFRRFLNQYKFNVDVINNIFFSHQQFESYIYVGQCQKSKIIRKLQNKARIISKCIYKNYVFCISTQNNLIVLDLSTGECIGNLDCYLYPTLSKVSVKDGNLVFQSQTGDFYRCKLRNN